MGSHVSRLFPGPRPPRLPACRSRHVKLPGTRAQRRKLRSRLRAARHQASAAGDAAVAAAVETVALRPAVARVLDSEARGRGLTRSSFCVAVLADYARDAAAPDRAAPSRRAPERVLPDSAPAPSDPSTCVPAVPPRSRWLRRRSAGPGPGGSVAVAGLLLLFPVRVPFVRAPAGGRPSGLLRGRRRCRCLVPGGRSALRPGPRLSRRGARPRPPHRPHLGLRYRSPPGLHPLVPVRRLPPSRPHGVAHPGVSALTLDGTFHVEHLSLRRRGAFAPRIQSPRFGVCYSRRIYGAP